MATCIRAIASLIIARKSSGEPAVPPVASASIRAAQKARFPDRLFFMSTPFHHATAARRLGHGSRRSSAPNGLQSDPARRVALPLLQPCTRSNPQRRVVTATIRLLQEDEHMTIKSKLATLFAAGVLASTVAAHAQGAMAPDPNIAPSTSAGEAEIPGT